MRLEPGVLVQADPERTGRDRRRRFLLDRQRAPHPVELSPAGEPDRRGDLVARRRRRPDPELDVTAAFFADEVERRATQRPPDRGCVVAGWVEDVGEAPGARCTVQLGVAEDRRSVLRARDEPGEARSPAGDEREPAVVVEGSATERLRRRGEEGRDARGVLDAGPPRHLDAVHGPRVPAPGAGTWRGAASLRSAVVAKPRSVAGRARVVAGRLASCYPGDAAALCALRHDGAFQLLVATILSAQTTDERVNLVTPGLFTAFPNPEDLAGADLDELEDLIRSTGFYHAKARSLTGMAQTLVERFDGIVPRTIDELVTLPGVGRKTANVVRSVAFGLPGLPVDTHVGRLAAPPRLHRGRGSRRRRA